MKCLETRKRPDGLTRRRYLLGDGRTLSTTVLREFSAARLQSAIDRHRRGEVQRARRRAIEQRLEQNEKPTAIAHDLGLTEQRVRQIRKAMTCK